MRFIRLDLERYGPFTDRSVNFAPSARVHILHGRNEAGKTSLLSAIGDLLFGFPARTTQGFLHRQSDLRIGATLQLRDGAALRFRRRKGDRNTIVDDNDRPVADTVLSAVLQSTTRDSFRNESGLTAQALRDGGKALLQAGGALAETLAASSSGLSQLLAERKRLDAEALLLFNPDRRAGSRKFYVALDALDAADRSLRDAIVTVDALKDAQTIAQAAQDTEAELDRQDSDIGRAIARLQRAARSRPALLELDRLRAEIAGIAETPAVSDAQLAVWRKTLDSLADLKQSLAELNNLDRDETHLFASLAPDPELFANSARIEQLNRRIGEIDKALDDLPRREARWTAIMDQLGDFARRLDLTDADAVLQHLPTDAALTRVRDLITAEATTAARLADARMRLTKLQDELAAQSDAAQVAPVDPAPLASRLALFVDDLESCARLERDDADISRESAALADELAQLTPPVATIETLCALTLPAAPTLELERRTTVESAQRIARLAEDVEQRAADVRQFTADIEALERQGRIVTIEDLLRLRNLRDRSLDNLGAVLDAVDMQPVRQGHFIELRALSRTLDEDTDIVMRDTKRATLKDQRHHALQKAGLDLEQARLALDNGRQDLASFEAVRIAGLNAAGLPLLAPGPLLSWCEQVRALQLRARKLASRRQDAERLRDQVEGARLRLSALLAAAGEPDAEALPFRRMHKLAQDRLAARQREWTQARERMAGRQRIETQVQAAEADCRKAEALRTAWLERWPQALDDIGARTDASASEASAILDIWARIPAIAGERKEVGHRIDTIRRDIDSFNSDVRALAIAIAEDIGDLAPVAAMARIAARLNDAQDARARLTEHSRTLARRDAQRQAVRRQIAECETIVEEAGKALRCPGITGLADAIGSASRLNELRRRESDALRHLLTVADGFDEQALRLDLADIEFDALQSRLVALQTRQTILKDEFRLAVIRAQEARKALEALEAGRDAGAAAQLRNEARRELLDVAQAWLLRAAASKLASLATERHRQAEQDPVLTRASQLFSLVTNDAFSGLTTNYDGDNPVLACRRAGGEAVPVEGLSEGTRDQLFLTLRLALLERRHGEPMPFVADDLLASFDETRALQALRMLAEFGASTQVLVLTHHRHIVEAAMALGDERIETITM